MQAPTAIDSMAMMSSRLYVQRICCGATAGRQERVGADFRRGQLPCDMQASVGTVEAFTIHAPVSVLRTCCVGRMYDELGCSAVTTNCNKGSVLGVGW